MTTRRAVGVDVAARRGCDVVALGDDLVARPLGKVHTAADLRALLVRLGPGVVAIDAPPEWAPSGRPRPCEEALRAEGIAIFATPDAARGRASAFYDWMPTGFAMFAGADGYPTLETFPHACAIALRGSRPERGLMRRPAEKRAWRMLALEAAGVDHSGLRTMDEVDAALCAVTGLRWLAGTAVQLGDDRAVITLPGPLPPRVRPPGTR